MLKHTLFITVILIMKKKSLMSHYWQKIKYTVGCMKHFTQSATGSFNLCSMHLSQYCNTVATQRSIYNYINKYRKTESMLHNTISKCHDDKHKILLYDQIWRALLISQNVHHNQMTNSG